MSAPELPDISCAEHSVVICRRCDAAVWCHQAEQHVCPDLLAAEHDSTPRRPNPEESDG